VIDLWGEKAVKKETRKERRGGRLGKEIASGIQREFGDNDSGFPLLSLPKEKEGARIRKKENS